ncbi:L,D-transpeptidase family protein [Saccharicrinis aurantiacus]|uniref:L,D-transpeptidase family protein n=1 Tax=Saccharicrinis aurantiacus TaxID=1849719 RepID=UPI0009501CB2|nr:L,D-transpeptidase family protein [Saccharicrinis aurantiacus]
MNKLVLILTALLFLSLMPGKFKENQKRYSRVRTAYAEKEAGVIKLLTEKSVEIEKLEIYLRAFKYEKEIELWARNKGEKKFKLIKIYDVCRTSGRLGPKRKEGDFQIPEGFYHIDAFNPASSYYLSMRINYPNKSDRILGYKQKLGGNICIHGNCVTIGCLPITDNEIKELYLFCIEAKDCGQSNIPVTVYPARLTNNNYKNLVEKYNSEKDKVNLWTDLKAAYDKFSESKSLPTVTFLQSGRHEIK